MRYAELHCKTNFSFLEGASHPDELVMRAKELGYEAMAVTDRESLAGVVRAHTAAKETGLKLIIGAEVYPVDAPPAVLWATDRKSYGRLSRLLTVGRRRAEKEKCELRMVDVAELGEGLVAGVKVQEERESGREGEGGKRKSSKLKVQSSKLGNGGAAITDEVLSTEYSVLSTNTQRGARQQEKFRVYNPPSESRVPSTESLAMYADIFRGRCYLLGELFRGPDDAGELARLMELSERSGVPLVAAGDVHYHSPARQPLWEVLTATRLGTTVDRLAEYRFANAQRHLRRVDEIAALFAHVPEAVERTLEIAERCHFSLDELKYEYPIELAPAGLTPCEFLTRLAWEGARRRYPKRIPEKVRRLVERELALIEELRYEAYFLTVWDLVRFAREQGILCQGRGSAANSAVCYCLEVTSVDPEQNEVLFERFVSKERNEAPDIDVDFEHERREEVLQYIYEKYGRERAGMTAVVITYRTRSAVRDVGKALGLSLDRVDALAKNMEGRELDGYFYGDVKTDKHDNPPQEERERGREGEGGKRSEVKEANSPTPPLSHSPTQILALRCAEVGIDPGSEIGRRLVYLVSELVGFPRHLSQHVGGMVITQGPLCELSPIENAAMPLRTVIEWDKDDLDDLGILKVDCLSLGMLTAIRKCFELIGPCRSRPPGGTTSVPRASQKVPPGRWDLLTLATVPAEDPKVYDMICKADTIGVFQIESRAQMSMLPRLKPREFYDLVIEVAIVRPGPIQGNMVHPYLRRRMEKEEVPPFPRPEIGEVLKRTLGVPLFQEQAMQLAVVAAGFSAGEADQLRRAMGAWRRPGIIDQFRKKLIEGMKEKGLSGEFAEQVFNQIRGFGEYGFPESHAASFALLVYVSAWLKCYYPAAFCAAIINSQPMGFYSPSQLIRDARAHGVRVLPVDVNWSGWDCRLEGTEGGGERESGRVGEAAGNDSPPRPLPHSPTPACLRLGLRLINGLPDAAAKKIEAAREAGEFRSLDDFVRRTGLSQAVVTKLAEADAFSSLAIDRRKALWQALGQERKAKHMPLLAGLADDEPAAALPPMPLVEQVFADYRTSGLSLKAHPISFFREHLNQMRVTPAGELDQTRDGRHLRVAGIVLLRQRPGTAKGITFATIEDETGLANLVIRPQIWERYYAVARRSAAWVAHGCLENKEGVIHLVVNRLEDLSHLLGGLKTESRDFH
ncbi:MAG TPA: error-prone DNA polymerase [Pirellulaceae bacterium]|jgi:error-prone DNA polymerase